MAVNADFITSSAYNRVLLGQTCTLCTKDLFGLSGRVVQHVNAPCMSTYTHLACFLNSPVKACSLCSTRVEKLDDLAIGSFTGCKLNMVRIYQAIAQAKQLGIQIKSNLILSTYECSVGIQDAAEQNLTDVVELLLEETGNDIDYDQRRAAIAAAERHQNVKMQELLAKSRTMLLCPIL